MATFTSNYNFRKPADGDFIENDTDINDNADLIDAAIKARADDILSLQSPHRGRMSKNIVQTLTDAIETKLVFQVAEKGSPAGILEIVNNRFVAQINGWYRVVLNLRWASGQVGGRLGAIYVNGAKVAQQHFSASGVTAAPGAATNNLAWEGDIVAGQAIEFYALHTQGAPLDVSINSGGTWASIIRVSA